MNKSQVLTVVTIGLAILLVSYYAIYVPRTVAFVLNPEALQIRGDVLYARRISRSDLQPQQAQIMNSGSSETVDIKMRTNGVGLPNYQSGWFSTSLGKALIFARPGRPMIAIPTIDGYTLLLAPQNRQEFLNALQTPASNFQSKLTD